MAEVGLTAAQRAEMLRCCWLGNSIVNNLQEPAIQIDELKKMLLTFQHFFEQKTLSASEQNMLVAELARQVEFIADFQMKLQSVLDDMSSLTGRERNGL